MKEKVVELLSQVRIPDRRVASQLVHVFLGANGAAAHDGNLAMGALKGLLLDSLAHSKFAESIAGGGALTAGYAFMALDNLEWHLTLDKIVPDWLTTMIENAKKHQYIIQTGDVEKEAGSGERAWWRGVPDPIATPIPTPVQPVPPPDYPVPIPLPPPDNGGGGGGIRR